MAAYEFLKKLFGTNEDGSPKPMTYQELEAAIDADKTLQLCNLSEGGFIAQDKYDSNVTELAGVKKQLKDANAEIQSYKEMDIDGIKKAAEDWEKKYNTDTAALNKKLADQATEFAVKEYMNGFQFSSPLAKEAATARFMQQGFKRDETTGKFLGADDFMASMKENNPGAFIQDIIKPEDTDDGKPKPRFAPETNPNPPKNGKKMTLTEKMKYMSDHPGTDVNTLFED